MNCFIIIIAMTIKSILISEIATGFKNSLREHRITFIAKYKIIGEVPSTPKNTEATAPVAPHRRDKGNNRTDNIINPNT